SQTLIHAKKQPRITIIPIRCRSGSRGRGTSHGRLPILTAILIWMSGRFSRTTRLSALTPQLSTPVPTRIRFDGPGSRRAGPRPRGVRRSFLSEVMMDDLPRFGQTDAFPLIDGQGVV